MSELSRLSRRERAVLKAIANGAVTWGFLDNVYMEAAKQLKLT
jgi:predicted Holliday junction resolvase-like endonuclease